MNRRILIVALVVAALVQTFATQDALARGGRGGGGMRGGGGARPTSRPMPAQRPATPRHVRATATISTMTSADRRLRVNCRRVRVRNSSRRRTRKWWRHRRWKQAWQRRWHREPAAGRPDRSATSVVGLERRCDLVSRVRILGRRILGSVGLWRLWRILRRVHVHRDARRSEILRNCARQCRCEGAAKLWALANAMRSAGAGSDFRTGEQRYLRTAEFNRCGG